MALHGHAEQMIAGNTVPSLRITCESDESQLARPHVGHEYQI